MQKLSELIGKKVLSLYEAREEGTLISCQLNPSLTKISYFELVSEENDASLFFSPSALFALSECAVLKNSALLSSRSKLTLSSVPCPINFPVYSPFGKSLGFVSDLIIEQSEVKAIEVGEKSFAPSAVLRRGEELLIINDGEEKIKLTPPKTQEKKPVAPSRSSETKEASVSAMPTVITRDAKEESVGVPVRLSNPDGEGKVGFEFLLGKIVNQNISGGEGELVASEGQIIDDDILEKATKYGKLVLLALHST